MCLARSPHPPPAPRTPPVRACVHARSHFQSHASGLCAVAAYSLPRTRNSLFNPVASTHPLSPPARSFIRLPTPSLSCALSHSRAHTHATGVNPRIQRGGVGRSLFESFRQAVTEEGANMMLVDTQRSNTPAVGFFQKLGFSEDEDSAHCYFTMETKGNVQIAW